MISDVGVGISGPGAIGACHARAVAAAGARVVAVSGPKRDDAASFAAEHGVGRVYDEYEALVADPEVTAVIVASPSPVHTEQTIAALRAGKHVLCEIPAGLGLAAAAEVVQVAAAADRRAAVGHTLRFWAPHRRVRAAVESGELRIRHVIGHSLRLRQRDVGWTGRARDWTDSVLWHQGGHLVDAALWFLDATDVEVLGTGGPAWPGNGRQMDVGAVLVAPSGDLATLSLSYHSRVALDDFLLIAEDRTWALRDGRLLEGDDVLVDSPGADATQERAIEAQDREFLSAIDSGRRPDVVVADVLPAMRVLQSLENARATRSPTPAPTGPAARPREPE